MQYGYFDDERREYVITTPRTPLPWINYLGSGEFFRLISNTGGGYCFYRDARLLRLTRYRYNDAPLDSNGHYFYIKDGDTVWNPGWQPSQTELDTYTCRHGLGYTIFEGAKNGITARQEVFVPLKDPCELTRITLTNETGAVKEIDLFSYVEFCLWDANDDATNFQRNFSIGEVEVRGSEIYHKTEYRERRRHYAVFAVNAPAEAAADEAAPGGTPANGAAPTGYPADASAVAGQAFFAGFDTAREAFLGPYGSPAAPAAVLAGRSTNSIAHGWAPIGSHHLQITLAPGETVTRIFLLGYCENPKEEKFTAPGVINKAPAEALLSRYMTDVQFDAARQALAAYWDDLLSSYAIASADPRLDRLVNVWNQYQCMVTFNMSRSASYFESGMGRGMGFRDSCQDLLGFVHLIPARARERILDIASTQFPDGSAYHQYQPLTKRGNTVVGTGFNDDPLWLIAGTAAYLRETGDFSILDEVCPFDNDPSNAASLMEHLRRSITYTREHLGPHGLPLIGRADWNDCLNLNCFSEEPGESFQITGPSEGPVAESVFIAGMFVKYGREYAAICREIDLRAEAADIEAAADAMEQTVLDAGWDGAWFRRAYDAFSNPVGSSLCEEGQIFIEPQGMCVMAGIGVDGGQAQQALDSVQARLETEYGLVLLQPAYTVYHPELGEITSYPPGYKENAGIFCHNNPWVVCAETVLGHGGRAFDLFRRTCPIYLEEISDIHRTEPYVYCQMIAGKDAPNPGEGKNSWLTGTAAWTFTAISQYILGIRPELDGLRIDPCIPADWDGFTCTRRFRGATYEITVTNPSHVESGVKEVRVNGAPAVDILATEHGAEDTAFAGSGAPDRGVVLPVYPAGSTVQVDVVLG